MVLIIGACHAVMGFCKSSAFAGGGSAVVVIGACLALVNISKSCEFADVGSAVVIGFENRGLPCVHGYF